MKAQTAAWNRFPRQAVRYEPAKFFSIPKRVPALTRNNEKPPESWRVHDARNFQWRLRDVFRQLRAEFVVHPGTQSAAANSPPAQTACWSPVRRQARKAMATPSLHRSDRLFPAAAQPILLMARA